ncbi:MAG: glycosyltransferase, partial [Candidatus Altarchaeaceae archaeon]
EKIKEKFNADHLILHVGRISKKRNIDKIIYSAKKVIEKFPNAKFLIIGDGMEMKNLENIVKNLNLENNVIFLGKIEQKFLPDYYKASDVFVTASTIDTQGLVVLESLACGTPVIAANSRALPEIVNENVNGFLFDYKNVEELSEKIIKILENKKLREKFSENGIKIAKEHDINKSVEKLIEIYEKFKFYL